MEKPDPRVVALAERIKALNPVDRIRFAAELLEAKQPRFALLVLEECTRELGYVMAAARREKA